MASAASGAVAPTEEVTYTYSNIYTRMYIPHVECLWVWGSKGRGGYTNERRLSGSTVRN